MTLSTRRVSRCRILNDATGPIGIGRTPRPPSRVRTRERQIVPMLVLVPAAKPGRVVVEGFDDRGDRLDRRCARARWCQKRIAPRSISPCSSSRATSSSR